MVQQVRTQGDGIRHTIQAPHGKREESLGIIIDATTIVCQAPLFSAIMMSHIDLSTKSIFKFVDNKNELGN